MVLQSSILKYSYYDSFSYLQPYFKQLIRQFFNTLSNLQINYHIALENIRLHHIVPHIILCFDVILIIIQYNSSLLMPEHSKIAQTTAPTFFTILSKALIGSNQKKAFSIVLMAIIAYLIYVKNKKSSTDNIKIKDEAIKKKEGGKGKVDAIFWKRIKQLVRIVLPTWKCKEALDLCLLTVFLVLRTFLSIYIAGLNGKIVKSIIERNKPIFIQRVFYLGLIAIPASFVNSFLDYLNKTLAINFKKRLTRYFHQSYLKDMTFYQLGNLDSRIVNPDQRLTADIQKWANSLSMIYSNFSKPLLDIILFSRKLSDIVGWQGPVSIYLWYILSGLVLKFFSPSFGKLTAIEQKLQGQYRFSHTGIVHHSQQIAFYKGNQWQKTRINTIFNKFINHSESIMNKKLFIGVFDSMMVKYGAVMVGYAVLGLPVFGPKSQEYLKKVGSDGSAITRDYIRNSSLLINLAKAIGKLVISYKQIQQLAGFTTLVYEMKEVLTDLQAGKFKRTQINVVNPNAQLVYQKGEVIQTQDYIRFQNVPLITPNGDSFVKSINFEVKRGVNTVVTGPNGCGKSSLFRILSGLWPLKSGILYRPNKQKLFYIPQRAYLPPGTLRDQVIYPHSKQKMQSLGFNDDNIRQLLKFVRLQYIEDREGGFDSLNDWADVLSGGEKQRMAMARLFYHKPMFGILDECTSAVSMDVEAQLYKKAKQLNITLFTVTHRSTLFKFHDYKITLQGNGDFKAQQINH